ncbi:MAG TPA: response regulator [Longimicrobium sp.]|jgi:CheY-like chemotaxis protein
MDDTARETRFEVALPLSHDRRERFDLRLQQAEDFLRQSLQELDSLEAGAGEGGTARAVVVDLPTDTWVATFERSSEREERAAAGVSPILVVDLQERSRAALGELLRTSGYPVLEAGSSSDFPADAELTPRLIVFDPGPYMDAALRTVARMRIQQAEPVPVVLLTAAVTPETRSQALAIGCAEVLPKPCAPAELLSVIGRLLGPAPVHAE